MKMYDSLSSLANVTSDSIRVYLKLFSVTDANQQILVRSKMSKIFQPNVRQALNQNTSGSFQVIFGGDSNVRVRKTLRKSLIKQPRRTPMAQRARRIPRRRARSLMIHVS